MSELSIPHDLDCENENVTNSLVALPQDTFSYWSVWNANPTLGSPPPTPVIRNTRTEAYPYVTTDVTASYEENLVRDCADFRKVSYPLDGG